MTRRSGIGAASIVAFLLAVACTGPQTSRIVDTPGRLPPDADLADVPFFPQEAYYCGPAALAMTLAWSGLPALPDEIEPQVYTPGREGTLASDIVAAARRHGRLAVPVDDLGDLLAEIAAGHPVIVFQNLALDWIPQWHFAVAVGYDLPERQIVLHTGTSERRRTSLDAFEHTWERAGRWALLTLPPDVLPVTEDRRSVLAAAAGLEQAGRHEAAATAYTTMAERWPDMTTAWFGLGNARFAHGDYPAAERAYRTAVHLNPAMAEAWNNLAYALHRQGQHDEAIAAARTALSTAQGDLTTYRDTFEEVSVL